MMYNDPRTWKYAVPAFMAILLGWGAWVMPEGSLGLSSLMVLLATLCIAIALTNWWRYVSKHRSEMFTEHQIALSRTPLVLLAENMKTMHPEAVKVLNRFGVRTNWQVRVNANMGTRDWLLEGTNVHFGFVEYVLARSGRTLLGRFKLSEGSRRWDPDGIVDDRQQLEEFESWLFARMMVTRSHGEFKPAEFIPPWTPELIMETMGLTGEQELFRPDEDVKLSTGKNQGKDVPEFIAKALEDLKQTSDMNSN